MSNDVVGTGRLRRDVGWILAREATHASFTLDDDG